MAEPVADPGQAELVLRHPIDKLSRPLREYITGNIEDRLLTR